MSEVDQTMYDEPTVFAFSKMQMDKEAQKRRSVAERCLYRIFPLACILGITIIAIVGGLGYSLMYLLMSNNPHPEHQQIVNALYELLSVTFYGVLIMNLGLLCAIMFDLRHATKMDEETMEKGIVRHLMLNWILFMLSYVVVTISVSAIGLLLLGH